MIFLTSEKDLKISTKQIIYFYSSNMNQLISNLMFNLLNIVRKTHKDINILCIDILNFKSFRKRFEIDEVPTLLIYNNSVVNKMVGIPTLDKISKYFERGDINSLESKNDQE